MNRRLPMRSSPTLGRTLSRTRVSAAILLVAAAAAMPLAAQVAAPAGARNGAAAAAPADAAHRRGDVARHRAIAAAHEAAARCLESGEPENSCHTALRKACEGLAVGRYCGMKHAH